MKTRLALGSALVLFALVSPAAAGYVIKVDENLFGIYSVNGGPFQQLPAGLTTVNLNGVPTQVPTFQLPFTANPGYLWIYDAGTGIPSDFINVFTTAQGSFLQFLSGDVGAGLPSDVGLPGNIPLTPGVTEFQSGGAPTAVFTPIGGGVTYVFVGQGVSLPAPGAGLGGAFPPTAAPPPGVSDAGAVVPEPGSLALFAVSTGVIGLLAWARRRRGKARQAPAVVRSPGFYWRTGRGSDKQKWSPDRPGRFPSRRST